MFFLFLLLEVFESVSQAALPLIEHLLKQLLSEIQTLLISRQIHDIVHHKQNYNEVFDWDFVLGVVKVVGEVGHAL